MYGETIEIFLVDGSPNGIKHVEIDNWSGQAVACPRSRLAELKKMEEIQRPGVYFLLAKNDTDEKNIVYIGETENFSQRITAHNDKDYWNEVIVFTNKDKKLIKGHVKYLEARLDTMTAEVDRYEKKNKQPSKLPSISKSKASSLEKYIRNIRIILGVLGHDFLEPINDKVVIPKQGKSPKTLNDVHFNLEGRNFKANGVPLNKEFIVFKGSEASTKTNKSTPDKVKTLRKKLISNKTIEERNGRYVFLKNHPFSSSSSAAGFISGASKSGPKNWKDENGLTLEKVEEELLQKD